MKHLILFFCLIVLWNCSDEKTKDIPSEFSVTPIDQNGLLELLKNRKGNILLLNIWATWCVPCREEFPDLIELKDFYKTEDVEIVGISVDYPDEVDSKIIPFLQSQKTNFKIYVQNFSDDSALINLLNTEWNGALPATFIYDKNGNQQTFLPGKRSFEEFKQEIEKVTRMN